MGVFHFGLQVLHEIWYYISLDGETHLYPKIVIYWK